MLYGDEIRVARAKVEKVKKGNGEVEGQLQKGNAEVKRLKKEIQEIEC